MERSESVYRHQPEGIESAANCCLADSVQGCTERSGDDITNGHRQTFRIAAANGQYNHWRTRSPRIDPDNAPGRAQSGNVKVSNSKHRQTGLNVSGNADTNVSANDLFNGQQLLTYPIRIPEEAIPHSSDYPFCLSLPRTERPTPEGGRSESQRRIAGFNDSASLCGRGLKTFAKGTGNDLSSPCDEGSPRAVKES